MCDRSPLKMSTRTSDRPVRMPHQSSAAMSHPMAAACHPEQIASKSEYPESFSSESRIERPSGDHESGMKDSPFCAPASRSDGGYVRAAHKQGNFEVIAGRSVVAFRRAEGDLVPPSKCFGFVQTYDQKPRPPTPHAGAYR